MLVDKPILLDGTKAIRNIWLDIMNMIKNKGLLLDK